MDVNGEFSTELDADDYIVEFVSGGSQELWVQNQEQQSRMQGPRLPSQQRGQNPVEL